MDPTATLKDIRDFITLSKRGSLDETDARQLVDLIEALDDWIMIGGVLPKDWAQDAMVEMFQCAAKGENEIAKAIERIVQDWLVTEEQN